MFENVESTLTSGHHRNIESPSTQIKNQPPLISGIRAYPVTDRRSDGLLEKWRFFEPRKVSRTGRCFALKCPECCRYRDNGRSHIRAGLPANIFSQGFQHFRRKLFSGKFTLRTREMLSILLSHPTLEFDRYVIGICQNCGVCPPADNHSTVFQDVHRRWRYVHLIIVLEYPYRPSLPPSNAGVRRSEVDSIINSFRHAVTSDDFRRFQRRSFDDYLPRLNHLSPPSHRRGNSLLNDRVTIRKRLVLTNFHN